MPGGRWWPRPLRGSSLRIGHQGPGADDIRHRLRHRPGSGGRCDRVLAQGHPPGGARQPPCAPPPEVRRCLPRRSLLVWWAVLRAPAKGGSSPARGGGTRRRRPRSVQRRGRQGAVHRRGNGQDPFAAHLSPSLVSMTAPQPSLEPTSAASSRRLAANPCLLEEDAWPAPGPTVRSISRSNVVQDAAGSTTTPSSSLYKVAPGSNVAPPNCTAMSRSPVPVFALRGRCRVP